MTSTPHGAMDIKVLRPLIAAGSTKTLKYDDDGAVVKLDTAAGSVVTLPKAIGSGVSFLFVVTVLATSNSHIVKVGNTTDEMQGIILMNGDTAANAAEAFAAADNDDTITLNRTTTGSVTLGEHIEVIDIAAGVWQVRGSVSATGTEATPFSATV
jgi:hypothetical protein